MKKEDTERYNKAKELRTMYDWTKPEERNICNELNRIVADYEKRKLEESKGVPLTIAQELAIIMHQNMCHWNHTDGCSWDYEIHYDEVPAGTYLLAQEKWPKPEDRHPVHDWSGYAHADYLEKANYVLEVFKKYNFTLEQLKEIITTVVHPYPPRKK